MADFANQLAGILDEVCGTHDHSMSRNRPYSGQPHTVTGERGSTEIRGITFRDLRDCFLRAFVQSHSVYRDGTIEPLQPNHALSNEASKGERACICEGDIYALKGDFDPIAVVQNLCCEVEKLMRIYPNVPRLRAEKGVSK
ncbi:hypothetical protein [Cupriavidus taiwanensis]|uniref:hypothetical protein n=1 Tax=Cupriavidus taiwanensis TaxID=164546 RepID=UPI000E103F8A|nr:hypothetical protein [Cupriavidus taiwanensis]SOY56805.1 hypothetical protein CBM2592_A90100 [Cupriavidus taiwanensis]SOY90706.1 hypothetical protein CBM2591_A90099 [Cupriavidus taiwanensis]SOZ63512.1 hypothetical protein CBM2617_A70076 [Cupriavidus taiwanensis]SOZ82519.1 hypothetical protein CBM2618_A80076 [Cupriavidus taiwanensis]SOZ84397.1 hypothetical protein CBM2622_A80076 [Cupriavidus taiwanensis]